MVNELAPRTEALEERSEAITTAAVTAAINCGFNPAGSRTVTVKQVVDACAIIVTFLKEAEGTPTRSVRDWRMAVENLSITLGPTKESAS